MVSYKLNKLGGVQVTVWASMMSFFKRVSPLLKQLLLLVILKPKLNTEVSIQLMPQLQILNSVKEDLLLLQLFHNRAMDHKSLTIILPIKYKINRSLSLTQFNNNLILNNLTTITKLQTTSRQFKTNMEEEKYKINYKVNRIIIVKLSNIRIPSNNKKVHKT